MRGMAWLRSRMACGVLAMVLVVPMGAPSAFAVARLETDEMRPRASSESGSVRQELERELGVPAQARAAEQGAVLSTVPVSALGELLSRAAGVLKLTPEGVEVLDEEKLRTETVHHLARAARFSPAPDVKVAAQRMLRLTGLALGIKEASIHPLYMASEQWHSTASGYNIRTRVYDTMRQIIRAQMQDNAGGVLFELAKSEQRYTGQSAAEYMATAYAAAIAEGYRGPLFGQGDHYQVDAKLFASESDKPIQDRKAIKDIEKLIVDSLEAGERNIDMDPSTLVNEAALDEVLAFERSMTTRYIQQRRGEDAGFDALIKSLGDIKDDPTKEAPGLWALRRKLVDDLEVVAMSQELPEELQEYVAMLEAPLADDPFNSIEQFGISAQGYAESLRRLGLTPDDREEIKRLYRKMHQTTFEVTMHFIRFIRAQERRLGLNTPISAGVEERHIDSEKHKAYPSTVLGSITLMRQVIGQSKAEGLVQPSKEALQTGSQHGLGGKVDWGIFVRHRRARRPIGVGVFVQHGTSTLPPDEFGNMPVVGTGEAHLATEYQKISFGIGSRRVEVLRDQMAAFLEALLYPERPVTPEIEAKVKAAGLWDVEKRKKDYTKFLAKWEAALTQQGEKTREQILEEILGDLGEGTVEVDGKKTSVKGIVKDLVKELSLPFKRELDELPPEVAEEADRTQFAEFHRINVAQGLVGTKELVNSLVPLDAQNVVLPAPTVSKALASAGDVLNAVSPYAERYTDEKDGQTYLRPSKDPEKQAGLETLRAALQAYETLFQSNPDRAWVLAQIAGEAEAGKVRSEPTLEMARALALADATFAVNPSPTPTVDPGKRHTVSIAVLLDDEGFRGIGKARKGEADDRAEFISLALQADRGVPGHVKFSEGEQDAKTGELPSGQFLTEGKPIVTGAFGEPEAYGQDVVEGTNAAATNNDKVSRAKLAHSNSGGTSIRFSGAGVDALGGLPDGYVHFFATKVPSKQRERIQQLVEQFILAHNPVEPYDEVKTILEQVAQANSTDLNNLEVVLLSGPDRPRETANIAALERITNGYPGFTVTKISDGTVAAAMLATMGRKQGKHVVLFSTSKRAEAAFNLVVARTLQAEGAVAAASVIGDQALTTEDGKKAANLQRRYHHSEASKGRIRKAQPADRVEALLNGTRALTPNDVRGPVEASMSLITDNGWFNLPGVQHVGDARSRVVTLRFSDPEGNGKGWHAIDVDDEDPADLRHQVARGTFALREPAAADPAVVDADKKLLALMQDQAHTHTFLVDGSVSAQTPGFFIAWERALERFQQVKGYKTREEAARESAVKVTVVAQPTPPASGTAAETSATLLIDTGSAGNFQVLAEKIASGRRDHPTFKPLQANARLQSSRLPGKEKLTITFSGARAAEAVQEFVKKPTVVAGVEAWQAWLESPDYAAAFAEGINTGSQHATRLTPDLFNVVLAPEDKPVAVAIGPKTLLDAVPQATVKVAYEPSAQPAAIRPSASVLHAGAEAVTAAAQGRKPDPAVLAKLDIFEDEGIFAPKEAKLDAEATAQEAVDSYHTYQATTRKIGIGG